MTIAGRLDEALQGLSVRGITHPELATYRIRRTLRVPKILSMQVTQHVDTRG